MTKHFDLADAGIVEANRVSIEVETQLRAIYIALNRVRFVTAVNLQHSCSAEAAGGAKYAARFQRLEEKLTLRLVRDSAGLLPLSL